MKPTRQPVALGWARFAAVALLVAAVAGCSDDPVGTSSSREPDAAGSGPVVASTDPLDDPTVDDGVDVGTTLAPPAALDELVAGLLASDRVGVPDDWFILDLDPALVDDPEFAGDLDPFRGLIECPPGAVRSVEAPWLSRRFSVGETFVDNGLLSIEVIVHLDDAEGHAERVDALQGCAASSGTVELVWSDSVVVADETPLAAGVTTDVLRIEAEPDEQTPFPYTVVATWLERSGFSVAAIVGGEPPADGWEAISERIAVDALLALEAG